MMTSQSKRLRRANLHEFNMSELPKRTREHILEKESVEFVRQVLPPEWLVESGQKDYGVDLVVEIVKGEYVTGAHFLMQLKATDKLVVRRGQYVAHTCRTSTLNYFLQRPELVVYLVYDAQAQNGYCIWIQDYMRNLDPAWKKQKTATVRIPLENKFDAKVVQEIAQRVLSTHEQAKWLAAVQTAQSPYFDYALEVAEHRIQISAFPKYPGALEDHPITVSGTFKFDQSLEGQAARQSLEAALKTGAPAEIDSRFFEGFVPDFAPELFAHLGDQFTTTKILMGPAASDKEFIARISVLDQEGHIIADIPYIDFRVARAGTEEITYSNEKQTFPLKILWRVNFKEQVSSISMKSDLVGLNVVQIRDILRIQRAFGEGTWCQITNLTTGVTVEERLPDNPEFRPDEVLEQIISDLALVQEKTKQVIRWTRRITYAEAETLKQVVTILRTGQLEEKAQTVDFSVDKAVAQNLANICAKSEQIKLRFDFPDYSVNLQGARISLGTATVLLPNAQPTQATLQTLQGLDELPDNEVVQISLNVKEAGVRVYYHEWLPKLEAGDGAI